jgi:hypothetical protein
MYSKIFTKTLSKVQHTNVIINNTSTEIRSCHVISYRTKRNKTIIASIQWTDPHSWNFSRISTTCRSWQDWLCFRYKIFFTTCQYCTQSKVGHSNTGIGNVWLKTTITQGARLLKYLCVNSVQNNAQQSINWKWKFVKLFLRRMHAKIRHPI